MNSSPDAYARSSWRIEPVGDRCLLVAFGDRVDAEVNRAVLSFAAWLLDHPLPGVIDVVPAFTTVALHYRPEAYAEGGSTVAPFARLAQRVREVLDRGVPQVEQGGRTVEIPCCYGGDHGPDLEEVAQRCGLSTEEVIRLHGESPSVIYTFYFAPGNPFAGGLDPRLSLPRRKTPRTLVPAGSVAIANGLTTIYQLAMPGGWNLIGRTPWNLFDIKQDPPVRLQLGDRLHFVPVTPAEFDRLYEARP
ncbi:5-oxoprolinase subunit PxpB [Achromobacter aloeverae]|uniref:Allophanate hydrolase subunit 1 n=1 Tax=Achromobacter aloeverae TaxID=1750518 RepID=A0A4Q1HR71_9BURK|nr:5-oxoprolinase subunit PxpB [Achromobacter aloeverae]RXN93093.1 allophanate hydrolase subunit 1 [Achromobacter aloeverae]